MSKKNVESILLQCTYSNAGSMFAIEHASTFEYHWTVPCIQIYSLVVDCNEHILHFLVFLYRRRIRLARGMTARQPKVFYTGGVLWQTQSALLYLMKLNTHISIMKGCHNRQEHDLSIGMATTSYDRTSTIHGTAPRYRRSAWLSSQLKTIIQRDLLVRSIKASLILNEILSIFRGALKL